MLLNPVNEGNNSNSSSNDVTQNYQTNQHTTIGSSIYFLKNNLQRL